MSAFFDDPTRRIEQRLLIEQRDELELVTTRLRQAADGDPERQAEVAPFLAQHEAELMRVRIKIETGRL